ncbi:hypothetical protein [Microbacterium lacus]|uniref:Uncharacterized protein n=1 Tax=Microbacterium lacus TaxID=415217 RepID=A0ABN2GDF8_9MICO
MDDYMWVLKDSERDLMRELEPKRLASLDEDDLLNLHKRVRRARNKHVKNYRRGAARSVIDQASRGSAAPKSAKARHRAEAFEEALAIVSERLAVVAHEEAERLRTERLARARAGRGTGPAATGTGSSPVDGPGRAPGHIQTTGGIKRDASSQSQGARRQAKRDSR